MVECSKVVNGYTWLMESLVIFNKYVKYEVNNTVITMRRSHEFEGATGGPWLTSGVYSKYMTKEDIKRLTQLGWVYGNPGNTYWTLSKDKMDSMQIGLDQG